MEAPARRCRRHRPRQRKAPPGPRGFLPLPLSPLRQEQLHRTALLVESEAAVRRLIVGGRGPRLRPPPNLRVLPATPLLTAVPAATSAAGPMLLVPALRRALLPWERRATPRRESRRLKRHVRTTLRVSSRWWRWQPRRQRRRRPGSAVAGATTATTTVTLWHRLPPPLRRRGRRSATTAIGAPR